VALKVLHEWSKAQWPDGTEPLLKQARDREPDEQVRRRIENVLAGRPLEEGLQEGVANE
jgi:hypothetical protein